MSPKKRMGNDPFANSPVFKEDKKKISDKAQLVEKIPASNTSSTKKTAASKSPDESGEILNKLNMALESMAAQKEEIELLRKELNNLKGRSIYKQFHPANYWLRFWFPWFPS